MLSSLLKEHHNKQLQRKEIQARTGSSINVLIRDGLLSQAKRKEAVLAANDLTHALVDHLNVGVAQAYLNQKRLDAEAKQLQQNAANFSKHSQQWLNLIEGFSTALKELGDVENWAKIIEEDMKTVNCALEYAYKAAQEA